MKFQSQLQYKSIEDITIKNAACWLESQYMNSISYKNGGYKQALMFISGAPLTNMVLL